MATKKSGYIGFDKMVKSGKSPALAAWIGRQKYGKEGMAELSKKGKKNPGASSKTKKGRASKV
jgi:hypothetical protein